MVLDAGVVAPEVVARITTGACLSADGELVASPGKGQAVELKAAALHVHGAADPEEYPLQKKKHTLETLRTLGHLRARSNTFAAVFRVRNALACAIHKFFQDRGFLYVHTPVISAIDAEGAGSMFQVTTLNLDEGKPPVSHRISSAAARSDGERPTGSRIFAHAFKTCIPSAPRSGPRIQTRRAIWPSST